MSIGNVNGALAAYPYAGETTSSKKAVETETGSTKAGSEAEEMAAFKKEFYEDLQRIRVSSSVVNVAINISEEAFQNMKDDPEYREKILSLLQRDLGAYYGSGPRRASVMLTVGATSKDYRGDSWPICNDSEFHDRSTGSFYKRSSGKRDRAEDMMERYLEKRAQAKKLQEKIWKEKVAEQELEHGRLMESWYGENCMPRAFAAYEASVMAEPAESRGFDSGLPF